MKKSITLLVLLSAGCAHTATLPPTTPKSPEPSVLGEPTQAVPEMIINAMVEETDNPYQVEYVQSPKTWSDLPAGCATGDPLCDKEEK